MHGTVDNPIASSATIEGGMDGTKKGGWWDGGGVGGGAGARCMSAKSNYYIY